jgi:hypothetical protein
MNPYDFARIDWNRPPERRAPIWHHQLTGSNGQTLYSGSLVVDVFAETPIFISDPRNDLSDSRQLALSLQNFGGNYIIPGSSLKGMLRSIVEALGNGCLTLFDGDYERRSSNPVDYRDKAPRRFQHCESNDQLCIACRVFGMLKERSDSVFLGKVNIGDAVAFADKVYEYDPTYFDALMGPKPHHQAFYLDSSKRSIAGRKFYFHHMELTPPGRETRKIFLQPLDYNTQFRFRVDFTALEADEFGALLFAIALEEQMRHKIGYGKPLGLGSVYLQPMKLTLIDYAARYRAGASGGKTELEGDPMWHVLYEHMDDFLHNQVVPIALDDLRRIWRWEPDPNVTYHYPERFWFSTPGNSTTPIAQTP